MRIAHAGADDVRRGRLAPGSRLPGTRKLAQTLGVDRDTVTAAFRQLVSEGWIEIRAARGAFVTQSLPERAPQRPVRGRARRGVPAVAGFRVDAGIADERECEPPRGPVLLSSGTPDLREFPAEAYARALRRVLRRRAGRLLAYGDPRGDERLRAALADMVSARRGLAASADDVVVV